MTARIADEGGMQSSADPLAVDEMIAERVVRGEDVGSLPRAYERLADVLVGIREPASAAELAGERDAVAAFRRVGPRPGAGAAARRRRHRVRTALAISAVVTLGVAGGAAATGRLPDRVQDAASALLERVGIDIPEADHPVTPPTRSEFEAAEDAEPMVGPPNTATPPPATARLRVSRAPSTPAVARPDHRDAAVVPVVGAMAATVVPPESIEGEPDSPPDGASPQATVPPAISSGQGADGPQSGPPTTPPGQAPDGPPAPAPDAPPGQAPDGPPGQAPDGPPGRAPDGPPGRAPDGPPGQATGWSAGSGAGWSAGSGGGRFAGAGARWSAGSSAGWSPRSGSRWAAR